MQPDAFMSQLSTFKKTDLLQIRQLTELLLGGTITEERTPSDERESILFDAVRAELAALGLNGKIPYTTLTSSNYYKSWTRGLGVVNQFIDQHFHLYIRSKIQHIGICRILIQILLTELRRQHIPPSLGTIARNLHRIPQTFDNQFPDYIKSGLAHLIVQAMTINQKSGVRK